MGLSTPMLSTEMGRADSLSSEGSSPVCSEMLYLLHHTVVAGVVFYAAACWGNNIIDGNSKRLDKLVKGAGSVRVGEWTLLGRCLRGE